MRLDHLSCLDDQRDAVGVGPKHFFPDRAERQQGWQRRTIWAHPAVAEHQHPRLRARKFKSLFAYALERPQSSLDTAARIECQIDSEVRLEYIVLEPTHLAFIKQW